MDERLNIPAIVDDVVESVKKIRKVILNEGYVKPEDLYDVLYTGAKSLDLIVENSIKKTSIDVAYRIYTDIYDALIPYLRDTLAIDNIKFIPTELNDNHRVLLDIYIEDTYYGVLDVFERTYKLPNLDRMMEIERLVAEKLPEYQSKENTLNELGYHIRNPKKLAKKDGAFMFQYRLNKKKAINSLKGDFYRISNELAGQQAELESLNQEYDELNSAILVDRWYDEKLNDRLKERLNIEVHTELLDNLKESEETV